MQTSSRPGQERSAAPLSRAQPVDQTFCVDMGGTSFDLSLIVDGLDRLDRDGAPGPADPHAPGRHPTIGAGGARCWLTGQRPRVGPRGARRSRPLLRPRRDAADRDRRELLPRPPRPGFFLGDRSARRGRGGRALSPSRRVGLDEPRSPRMLSIVNANMADAMRTITVSRTLTAGRARRVRRRRPMRATWLAASSRSPGDHPLGRDVLRLGMLQTDIATTSSAALPPIVELRDRRRASARRALAEAAVLAAEDQRRTTTSHARRTCCVVGEYRERAG